MHLLWGTVFLIHLVDYHNGFELHLNGLLQHEACLWHRPLKGIYKQEYPVGHIEHTLHLPTKVGVAWGIYDIDFCALIIDRYILREDSDPAFAFQIIVIQNQLARFLVIAKERAVV